jgi:hypothetical protein
MQMVLCGDLMQLPPDSKFPETVKIADAYSWSAICRNTISLTENHRQKSDAVFFQLLQLFRERDPSPNQLAVADALLRILSVPFDKRDSMPIFSQLKRTSSLDRLLDWLDFGEPRFKQCLLTSSATSVSNDGSISGDVVHICPLNVETERMNSRYVNRLQSPIGYKSNDGWCHGDGTVHSYSQDLAFRDSQLNLSPYTVLAVGARVILTTNLSVPDGLANGSIGRVIDFHETDIGDVFPVVRFKSLKGETDIIVHPCVEIDRTPLYQNQHAISTETELLFRFRRQLPLKLAHALTVHRCQGQTLPRAIIHLRNIFEYGQFYTAMSRMKSLFDVQLVGYDDVRNSVSVRDQIWNKTG